MTRKNLLVIAIVALFISCGEGKHSINSEDVDIADTQNTTFQDSENEDSELSETVSSDEDGLEDGTYPANIDCYNPNTGHSSTYTLDVKVRNGRLVEIEWENGGWLDESHFTAPDITDGTASFTDDEGREFTVTLTE
ncbi:hypothetical protein JSO59_007255 [Riemerella anatipestifer]|uniref:hypothetical protein n=1 Tax=Riemerella anatipestifer TaxID=34085 RepID=UPI0030BD9949